MKYQLIISLLSFIAVAFSRSVPLASSDPPTEGELGYSNDGTEHKWFGTGPGMWLGLSTSGIVEEEYDMYSQMTLNRGSIPKTKQELRQHGIYFVAGPEVPFWKKQSLLDRAPALQSRGNASVEVPVCNDIYECGQLAADFCQFYFYAITNFCIAHLPAGVTWAALKENKLAIAVTGAAVGGGVTSGVTYVFSLIGTGSSDSPATSCAQAEGSLSKAIGDMNSLCHDKALASGYCLKSCSVLEQPNDNSGGDFHANVNIKGQACGNVECGAPCTS